jgi:DNA-binding XRE family transcriptional regulator
VVSKSPEKTVSLTRAECEKVAAWLEQDANVNRKNASQLEQERTGPRWSTAQDLRSEATAFMTVARKLDTKIREKDREKKSYLTAYIVDDDRILVYDDSRNKTGDPCLSIQRESWLSLARFLLIAYETGPGWELDEISLKGGMGELTEEV